MERNGQIMMVVLMLNLHHLSMKIYKHTKGEREKGWLTYNIIIS